MTAGACVRAVTRFPWWNQASGASCERGQDRGGGGSGLVDRDRGRAVFKTSMSMETSRDRARAKTMTFKALETQPLDEAHAGAFLLLSHGACAGDPELSRAGFISSISMPAIGNCNVLMRGTVSTPLFIGLVHAASAPPAIMPVEKNKARRNPRTRFCTDGKLDVTGRL